MPTDAPPVSRTASRYVPERYVIRVGSEWTQVRATPIRPIADALEARTCLGSADACGTTDAGLMHELLDAAMIAPPAVRRRRDRRVSSRAVFYQAAGS